MALTQIINEVSPDMPGTVVVQRMPRLELGSLIHITSE